MKLNDNAVSTYNSIASISSEYWRQGAVIQMPLSGSARPWICRDMSIPLLVVLPDSRQARDFVFDGTALIPSASFSFLEEIPFREAQALDALQARRGEIMGEWVRNKGYLVATPAALMAPLTSGSDCMTFYPGDELGRDTLIQWLLSKGYERVDLVWSEGQFAFRGSIVDVFDPKDMNPTRVEFYDDLVESARFFSPQSQKSLRPVSYISIHALSTRNRAHLFSYFPGDLHILLFEPKEIESAAGNAEWLSQGLYTDQQEYGEWLDWEQLSRKITLFPRLRITKAVAHSDVRLSLRAVPSFRGKSKEMETYCLNLEQEQINIQLVSETKSILNWGKERGYSFRRGAISEGFVDPFEKIAFLGDLELSGVTLSRSVSPRSLPSDWLDRLEPGQILIHEKYGLCAYVGLEQVNSAGESNEYLVLQFAEARRLMIPVTQLYMVSPYDVPLGQEVSLDNLRGTVWKKNTQKAKDRAREAAAYLIKIHATREIASGFAFPKNEELMTEFEKTFPYVETVDQLKAIHDVFADMERSSPMDRLIIGDVGYGKTEVALRAVAKSIFSGKQALVMAPTTLLVQQHFETFQRRLDVCGIRVEMLSRFISASEQKKILGDVKEGRIDVLIGTHRLLGADVSFHDLGLVVIDEEHRFGVVHKEHLKKIRPDVDILLLSATPIPRSLYLSLTGLRDMSLLQTPPYKRLPVISAVGPWSETLVKNAVLREKSRGGQVYFVHNRIHDIEARKLMLCRLFPELTIEVIHGRVAEPELERVMKSFIAGKIDILVCTTIVESGLDIPKANTLIIDDAHELGLAQLYQLRGRVGRREEQAFALFLYPRDIQPTQEATERLEAIAELGETRGGYYLSRRDLFIRGGGDLVGFSQHGHMNRIGFQLYCTMLEEEISKLRGDWKEKVVLEISIPCAIPEEYIPQDYLRVGLYRRLWAAKDESILNALIDEMRDRFGPLPPSLQFLFDVVALRVIGEKLGFINIQCGHLQTTIQLRENTCFNKRLPSGWIWNQGQIVGPGGYAAVANFLNYILGMDISDTITESV